VRRFAVTADGTAVSRGTHHADKIVASGVVRYVSYYAAGRSATVTSVLPKASLPLRLGLLVAGMVFPLTVFAAVLVYYNYDANRTTAYDRILQIARSLASNIDAEVRATIASLQVLALSEALERGDLDAFRAQAEHFVQLHFPQSNVIVADAGGQQLLNTAVAAGTSLAPYLRAEALHRVFTSGDPDISDLLLDPVLRRNVVVVEVPVRHEGKVVYLLAASLPLTAFSSIILRQRPAADWTIAVFDKQGVVIARSHDAERFVGRQAAPSLYPALMSQYAGVLDTTTFDGTLVLTGFSRSPFSGWSVAVGIPKSNLTSQLWRSVAVLTAFGVLCLAIGILIAARLATHLARSQADRELLINELNHRVKNTIATMQGLIGSTLRSAASMAEARTAVEERIVALGRAHDVLTEEHWGSADLRELLVRIIEPHRAASDQRADVSGPDLRINPRATVAIAMVFNELATNAVKYGALSRPDGHIRITWSTGEENGQKLQLVWKEIGGPSIQPPTRRGFGSALLEQSITRELGGTVTRDFDPAGLTCTITVPLERLR
jgi:two-component sensor histidine kinase